MVPRILKETPLWSSDVLAFFNCDYARLGKGGHAGFFPSRDSERSRYAFNTQFMECLFLLAEHDDAGKDTVVLFLILLQVRTLTPPEILGCFVPVLEVPARREASNELVFLSLEMM